MTTLLPGIIGLAAGIFLSLVTMKINFKHNVIKSKVIAYSSLFSIWLKMRNKIYDMRQNSEDKKQYSQENFPEDFKRLCTQSQEYFVEFDRLYAKSFLFIGKVYLLSQNDDLSEEIRKYNQKIFDLKQSVFYDKLTSLLDAEMNKLLNLGLELAKKIRKNIEDSSTLCCKDFYQILSRLFFCKQK